jgi:flagellar basal-body rod protein FlgB
VSDVTVAAIHSALNGLALRQRVIADNIANINTPGYHAKKVEFESALASAVSDGAGSVDANVRSSLEPTREDGNNVNLDHETLANVDTGLRYQLMLRAMDGKFGLLRDSIRGQ